MRLPIDSPPSLKTIRQTINSRRRLTQLLPVIFLIVTAQGLRAQSDTAAQPPFTIGERLNFKVYLEFILGGDASMSVKGIEDVNGHSCQRLVSEAHSTPTVDAFYKVRDRVESWRDLQFGFSRRYVKTLREGKYKDDKRVEYATEDSLAFLYRGSREIPETLSVSGGIHDVLNAFYAMRERDLQVGRSEFIDLHDINQRYLLEVKVLRRESVEVPVGKFRCLVVEPELQSAGLFRKEGELQIWLTDDQYKMPVLMKSKLYFGRVWAKLVGYSRGDE